MDRYSTVWLLGAGLIGAVVYLGNRWISSTNRKILQDLEKETEQRTGASLRAEMEARIETRRKLDESELLYRSVVQDQTDMIVRFDQQGTIAFANRAYCDRRGMPLEQILGQNVFDAIHPDYRQNARDIVRGLNAQKPEGSFTFRVIRPDKTEDWAQWTARAIYDADGIFVSYQAIGKIVTELVEAEERLREQEEQLRHSGRLSVLGEMVAGVAHEIRQPLNSIAMYAFAMLKYLESHSLDSLDRIKQWNHSIVQQVDRADQIVRHLREFSKRAGSEPRTFDLVDLAKNCVQMLAFEIRRFRVQVQYEGDGLVETQADRLQIEQVLVNLIRNACESMKDIPHTPPKLVIDIRRREENAEIRVRDVGPGVDESRMGKMFMPFCTTKKDGLGLGLTISRSIIEDHQGKIWAYNTHPGLCVVVSIPLKVT
jgi:PAS domain S-box-containing protein